MGDIKKTFEKHENHGSFLKVTSQKSVESSQKAALNRKGNQMFNAGDIEGARRIFLTTKYSDGLSRVGDYFKSKNQLLDALQMYWIAPDRTKSESLLMNLASVLQGLIDESSENSAYARQNEQNIDSVSSEIQYSGAQDQNNE